jgi:GT2 family glycosyltransferase
MNEPKFSIVINTCDRRDFLLATIAELESQTYGLFEVVVVVGPTRDDSAEAVRQAYGERVVLRACSAFNLSTSRNVGVAAAAGEVVAFIDDDAAPAPTWLAQLARAYATYPEVAGFGGRTFNVNEGRGELQFLNGWITALGDQEDVRPHADAALPPARYAARWYPRFHGTNQSYRRQALAAVRGFDERFEYLFDDSDIAVRMARAGLLLRHLPRATVYHSPATGRNRGSGRFDINWYCWLRSTVYFTLQNGRGEVGLANALRRAAGHASWFWELLATVERNGDLDAAGVVRARRQLRRALREGLWTGVAGRRRMPPRLADECRTFLPFLRHAAAGRARTERVA